MLYWRKQDFYDMATAYLIKIHAQNVVHTKIMIDPQTHTNRGVSFDNKIIQGIYRAMKDAKKKCSIAFG